MSKAINFITTLNKKVTSPCIIVSICDTEVSMGIYYIELISYYLKAVQCNVINREEKYKSKKENQNIKAKYKSKKENQKVY